MNFSEFIIIYLSLGAPLAVYYFLQNRNRLDSRQLWLKTILNFVFWIPSAIRIFGAYLKSARSSVNNFDFSAESDSANAKLTVLQRRIENSFIQTDPESSLFEIREILDRYAGLTLEVENLAKYSNHIENEFFKIANKKDSEIASICNQRRNLKRLLFHQKLAANDFLELISGLHSHYTLSKNFCSQVLEFSDALGDFEMKKEIKKMFAAGKQTSEKIFVSKTEKDLWITDQPKPLKTKPLSMSFQTMKATTNLSTKD